ncbi:MAG: hypothetical protein LC437_04530 [Thiohalomonas sp.]|nr:hypothetical protein [Thiohalomonas sp.]
MICVLGEKDTRYLSDILRYFNHLTRQSVKYKPFHNQLSKEALAELMKAVADKVFRCWINDVLRYNNSHFLQFNKVLIQDGSSFSVKKSLKNIWSGRFTKISPAAIELHATINLHNGSFKQGTITPDTFSERAEMAEVDDLKGYLFLVDRGYYSSDFILKLDEAGELLCPKSQRLKTSTGSSGSSS